MLATALAPVIGYDAQRKLAAEALGESGRTIRDLALERGMDPGAELDRLLDPASMTEPGLGGGSRRRLDPTWIGRGPRACQAGTLQSAR